MRSTARSMSFIKKGSAISPWPSRASRSAALEKPRSSSMAAKKGDRPWRAASSPALFRSNGGAAQRLIFTEHLLRNVYIHLYCTTSGLYMQDKDGGGVCHRDNHLCPPPTGGGTRKALRNGHSHGGEPLLQRKKPPAFPAGRLLCQQTAGIIHYSGRGFPSPSKRRFNARSTGKIDPTSTIICTVTIPKIRNPVRSRFSSTPSWDQRQPAKARLPSP